MHWGSALAGDSLQ